MLGGILFWNHAIVFLQEGFIEILIGAFVNFDYISKQEGGTWGNLSLVFNNVVTIFLTIAMGVLILFIAIYLWPRIGKLKKKKYKEKFGSAYEMITTKKNPKAMLFPLIFFARRILLVVTVCAMIDYPVFQIFFFMIPTIAQMINLGQIEPMLHQSDNRVEIYNSFSILLLTYCLLCFTQFIPDAATRY